MYVAVGALSGPIPRFHHYELLLKTTSGNEEEDLVPLETGYEMSLSKNSWFYSLFQKALGWSWGRVAADDWNPVRAITVHTSLYHPSGLSQWTSPKHPVSCIEPGLVTRFIYDIHVSMPFSQIIPPSPSPIESKGLFYTSVSLLLSRIQGYCYLLSKFHIYALV